MDQSPNPDKGRKSTSLKGVQRGVWIRTGFSRRDLEANATINAWINGRIEVLALTGGRESSDDYFNTVQSYAPLEDKPVETGNRLKYLLLQVIDFIHARSLDDRPADERGSRLTSIKIAVEALKQPLFPSVNDSPASNQDALSISMMRAREMFLSGKFSGERGLMRCDHVFDKLHSDMLNCLLPYTPTGKAKRSKFEDNTFTDAQSNANVIALGRSYAEYTVLMLADEWAETHSLTTRAQRELLLDYFVSCVASSELSIPTSHQSR